MPDTILVDRAEYDALKARVAELQRELDERDAAILDAARQRDPADYLPIEAADRIFAGEHPLKVWREHRGLSPDELATQCEMAVAELAAIENGDGPGTITQFSRLATALGLDIDDLVPARQS